MSDSLIDDLLNDIEAGDDQANDSADDALDSALNADASKVKMEDDDGEGALVNGADGDEKIKVEYDSDDDVKPTDFALPAGSIAQIEMLTAEEVSQMQLDKVSAISKVAKLAHSKQLSEALERIQGYKVAPTDLRSDSAQYEFVVRANNMSVELDNEMLIVHKFIRDHYHPRFPELEELVAAPLPFCRAILALGNGPDLRGNLKDTLSSGAVMAVSVTAATTKGKPLAPEEWQVVADACETMFRLDSAKQQILAYVESRISSLAPNVSEIVGTQIATKILGIAGGLHSLSQIPHSNIYLLGASKEAGTGFSTASHSVDRRHTGFIYQSPIAQSARPEHRMKAQRKVGAKVALATRVDVAGGSPDGSFGRQMLDKLESELERLAAPPPKKVTKALPRPDEAKKKRRGGKRARKAKEAYASTELSKLQNRVRFGEAEEETGAYDDVRGMGMIGGSSGRVRADAGDARTKAKMTKRSKERIGAMKASGSTTSGLATSLAFTPFQGIELVDPSKTRAKVEQANATWFDDGTFTHVRKGGGIGPSKQ